MRELDEEGASCLAVGSLLLASPPHRGRLPCRCQRGSEWSLAVVSQVAIQNAHSPARLVGLQTRRLFVNTRHAAWSRRL
jgi:hypothetical protein